MWCGSMGDRQAMRELAAREIDDCKRHYDLGDIRFLVQAVRLALRFDLPVPQWAAGEAEKALLFYFNKGGAPGKGKTGGNLARQRLNAMHRERHRLVAREIARGANKSKACERASEELRSRPEIFGTAREVRKSYDRIERLLKSDP